MKTGQVKMSMSCRLKEINERLGEAEELKCQHLEIKKLLYHS